MNRIRLLDKSVAEMIAAGEVVERPASAVKELLENAIDAGATAVTLEIKNGGVAFIRVADNGCGILREDLPNAFLRHATSKVRTAEDLEAIGTLGFRGEALASVAAVAHVELITRTDGESAGSRITADGGVLSEPADAGCPRGTTVIVRELFYNTPARMKFLKKDVSEGNAVATVAQRIALSHPEVSLKFIRDGRVELHTPGDSRLLSAVHAALGREFAENLIPADYELNGVRVGGFVIKPVQARASRGQQHFFLNGRLVRSKTAAAALEEAYRGSIMVGRYPGCVLCLGMSPSLVDVNVHPAKIEVRFANEKQVFDAVYYAVKNALAAFDTRPEMPLARPAPAKLSVFEPAAPTPKPQMSIPLPVLREPAADTLASSAMPAYEPFSPAVLHPVPGSAPRPADEGKIRELNRDLNKELNILSMTAKTAEAPLPAVKPEPLPTAGMQAASAAAQAPDTAAEEEKKPFRLIGQLFDTYLLAESGDELLLIDKHAAHERILYEELRAVENPASQALLEPRAVSFSPEEYGALLGGLSLLQKAGFEAEDFGGTTLLVRAVPAYLQPGETAAALSELAVCLLEGRREPLPEKLESLYHSVACRAAVKAGDKTGPAEAERLMRRILEFGDIRYCPHGRPVAAAIKRGEIEKQFGRI